MRRLCRLALTGLVLGAASIAQAGEVRVVAAQFRLSDARSWQVSATVEHADEGWEHYADAWRVVGEDGTVYATRTLYHPHVAEQPFTRSLSGVRIPDSVSVVFVEARDTVHGWSPQRLRADLGKAVDGRLTVKH